MLIVFYGFRGEKSFYLGVLRMQYLIGFWRCIKNGRDEEDERIFYRSIKIFKDMGF